jgi:hypothetical protein
LFAARRPEFAARQFVDALNAATGCVTARHLALLPPEGSGDETVTARFPDPVSLRSSGGGPSGLLLDVVAIVAVTPAESGAFPTLWAAKTAMYQYRLLDRDHTELLVYHWQPGPASAGPSHPHLHVSAALRAKVDARTTREIGLDKLHIATGLVSLAAVVRMLIVEFGVAPQRADWRETLDRIEAAS